MIVLSSMRWTKSSPRLAYINGYSLQLRMRSAVELITSWNWFDLEKYYLNSKQILTLVPLSTCLFTQSWQSLRRWHALPIFYQCGDIATVVNTTHDKIANCTLESFRSVRKTALNWTIHSIISFAQFKETKTVELAVWVRIGEQKKYACWLYVAL